MQRYWYVIRAGIAAGVLALGVGTAPLNAQAPAAASPPATTPAAPPSTMPPGYVAPPADYVIGPNDALSVQFWRDKDMSADVVVRPDGKITLPLINDVQAAGLTPEQLRVKVTEAGSKFVEDPTVQIYVREIRSRQVFITGMVNKPGPYQLNTPMTVMQLIAMAGGLQDFADDKNITIIRVVNGQPMSYRFNYKDVVKRKKDALKQNIYLKPGDTVAVP